MTPSSAMARARATPPTLRGPVTPGRSNVQRSSRDTAGRRHSGGTDAKTALTAMASQLPPHPASKREELMRRAIELALQAKAAGEAPFGTPSRAPCAAGEAPFLRYGV